MMLYSQEELPESVFKSLLAAPHARKIFTSVYDEVWRQCERSRKYREERKRNELAVTEAWKAVKEAYGLSY
jgi:cation transport regulator ChaB